MSDGSRPTTTRLEPTVAWKVVTESPLLGLSLAREAGVLLVWDEGRRVELYGPNGEQVAATRSPAKVISASISDDGTLIALLVEGPRLIFLGRELEPIADRPAASESSVLAIDPHGRYVAVASKSNATQFYTRHGKPAGRFETIQALGHLRFVPDRPLLLGASIYGSLFGIQLSPGGKSGTLDADIVWQQRMLSNVGRLATTGDGGMILASCYTHGVQRFDIRGHSEGAYHLGGTAAHAMPDFAGRTIAVATTEGELSILNGAGNVRWKASLPRAPVALECDALGRFIIHGLPTGEITRLDLDGRGRAANGRAGDEAAPTRGTNVRAPDWSIPIAQTDEQAATAVVTVLDDPPRIGVVTSRNQLQVFTPTGGALGEAPEIAGVGRILRTAPGWIAAATDRQVVLYDARRNSAQRIDLSLVEVTHLVIRPDAYGLAIVQERDRLARASVAGRWVWKRELRSPVEDLAVSPDAFTAISGDDGKLLVFDPAGEPAGQYAADPPEALAMVAAPSGSPANVAWITLARRFQVLRGHRRDGRVLWESPVPWEPWQMHSVGPWVVVEAPDGRAIAFDGTGHQRAQSRSESAPGAFFPGLRGGAWRVVRQGVHLICSELSGRVIWRAVADEGLGPIGAGRTGVAAVIGRSLAWFPARDDPEPE